MFYIFFQMLFFIHFYFYWLAKKYVQEATDEKLSTFRCMYFMKKIDNQD